MYPLEIAMPLIRWLYGWVRTLTDWVSVFSIPFYEVFKGHNLDYFSTMAYYDGFPLPRLMNDNVVHRVYRFPVRQSDVFIVGFPKSGTTWLQIALSMLHDDWGTCKLNSHDRVPILEMPRLPGVEGYRQCLEASSPRLIKSHLPYRFFPKLRSEAGCKVIYISRNPKDVCVSFFHMLKGYDILDEDSAWNMFQECFIKGDVMYGSWFNHVTSWWDNKDENVLYITYEEMKKDTRGVLRKVVDFLGRPVSDERFEEVLEQSAFNKMSKLGREKLAVPKWFYNQKTAPFFRKGKVGDWRNKFTKEENETFDREIGSKVKERGLEFLYDW